MRSAFYDDSINMKNLKSQRGFILLVAIIACAILAALGILVFTLSTEDLKTSVSTLGGKKALGAVESGYHIVANMFDPSQPPPGYGMSFNGTPIAVNTWYQIDPVNDPGSQFKITQPQIDIYPSIQAAGFSMDQQSQGYGFKRYFMTVEGSNSSYGTDLQVAVGFGCLLPSSSSTNYN